MTEKHTTDVVRGKQFWVGLSDMQGWRISMEDAHSVHLYLPPSSDDSKPYGSGSDIPAQPEGSTVTNNNEPEVANAMFGVFDGHGGQTVAKFAGTTLHSRLSALDTYSGFHLCRFGGWRKLTRVESGDYTAALTQAFIKTDEDLRADPSFLNDPSGCTAVVGLITTDGRIIVVCSCFFSLSALILFLRHA